MRLFLFFTYCNRVLKTALYCGGFLKRYMIYYKTYNHDHSDKWVVLLHGAGGSSTLWYRQIRPFAREFNVLLIDLRGHGRSKDQFRDILINQYSFDEVSNDVIEVLDKLGIEQAHFVGLSLGTIVTRYIAEVHPERVASLVMGGAVLRLNRRSRFLMRMANLTKKIIPYQWIYSTMAFILMPKNNHKESRTYFIKEGTKWGKREFLKWFAMKSEILPLLRYFYENEIKKPVLYLMGEEDYMFLPAIQLLVKQQKHSILQIIPGAGHVCNVDQPDDFNNKAIAFLQQQ